MSSHTILESFSMIRAFERMIGTVGLLAIGVCLSGFATAAEKKKKKKARWRFESSYKILGTATESQVIKEDTNPDNAFYQLPIRSLLTEFRPELTGSFRGLYKLVLRPRAYVQEDFRERESTYFKKEEVTSKAYVNEAYFAGNPSSTFQYVIGTQNYQWGPAELASPSNPIFRDLGFDKTYFYETRGRAMIRVNYSPNGQTSIILLGEPTDNGADRPEADHKFHKKTTLKIEYSDESQTNYIGFTLSVMEEDRASQGAYGHYEIAPGFTGYFDLLSRIGSRNWYPLVDASGARFSQNLLSDDKRSNTVLLGFRYVTERGWDMRLEGFYDEGGWTLEQKDLGKLVLFSAPTVENANLYVAPGSFFPGQKFIYGSIRVPDWGYKDSFTFSLRNLHSLADNTEKLQATLDTFLNDHLIMSTGITVASGPKNGQLTQAYAWQAFLSAAWTF